MATATETNISTVTLMDRGWAKVIAPVKRWLWCDTASFLNNEITIPYNNIFIHKPLRAAIIGEQ
jgi:hypothetical protein